MNSLLIFVLLFSCFLARADYRAEIKLLESKFLDAQFVTVVYKHENLPADVKFWVRKVTYSDEMSNFGEAYNEIDLVNPELPSAQHQYTLLTDEFAATLLKVGGFTPTKWLTLIDRSNENFACKYHLHWKIEFKEALKYLFEHKKEAVEKGYLIGLCKKIERDKDGESGTWSN